MRINKERAKLVQTRPDWLLNDNHWSVFTDYRDSKQSSDELAVLHQLSRAQVQNIVRNVIERYGRPGELSARAVKALQSEGLTLAPEKLQRELEELKLKAELSHLRNLATYVRCIEGCGLKTTEEILKLYEVADVRSLTPAA